MAKLDGSESTKELTTAFDTHEQVVRQPHTHDPAEGYKPAEYEHQEFPKVVEVNDETQEPVLAHEPEKKEE